MANVCIAVPAACLSVSSGVALPITTVVDHYNYHSATDVSVFHVAREILSVFVFTGRTKKVAHALSVSIARSLIAPFCVLRSMS